jgi:hypothetical protein
MFQVAGARLQSFWDLTDNLNYFPIDNLCTRFIDPWTWCAMEFAGPPGPVAGAGRELTRAASSDRFHWRNLTMSRGKEGEGLRDPHRRQVGAAR